ncbi:condensation domain-containing protein [Streptomyces sp. NPDC050264]|uniref:condensation domain-containing protein n=1 Tax=Streptomyces sp. NPDC050264 TaxID=3155038 RepID=UPI0034265E94
MTEFQPHGSPPAATAGPGTDKAGTRPLTERQIALLRRSRTDSRSTSRTVPFAIDLRGPLDVPALEEALARLVARHPTLTARIRQGADAVPCLDIDPARTPVLERRTAGEPGHAPSSALLAEARKEPDPHRTGMLRAVLIGHRPEHHTLLLVVHRVVVEGESAGLLLADLLDAYDHGERPGAAPRAIGAHVFGPAAGAGSQDAPPGAAARPVPVTPHQHGLLLDALAHRGTGRYVEQLFWHWHGPLDTDRFTAAWQSVFDCESVLRAAFDWNGTPQVVVHDHVCVEVTRHPRDTADWETLLERDRLRGFDLGVPGLLRATLLDGVDDADDADDADPIDEAGTAGTPSTRVLITFHHVLLDSWSVSVLLQEFYRAYLADGRLPGGERRPDFRDHASWLAAQDTAPARAFWSAALPPAAPRIRPGLRACATGLPGRGRARALLDRDEAGRLRAWSTGWAVTESIALQAVWALLLYRASGADGPAPVGFGVVVSGRGIALDAVERLPGLLLNTLPMVVRVDPRHPLPRLLAELRDRTLDMASYEWVSADQIHEWSGRRADEKLFDSLIAFENPAQLSGTLTAALAAQDIRVDPAARSGPANALPVTLLATAEGEGLLLTAVHDRGRITDTDARRLVELCARLLRELPATADESTTVGDVLAGVPDAELPRVADRAPGAAGRGGAAAWPDVPQTRLVREAWRAVFGSAVHDPAAHAVEAGAHPLLAVRLLHELNRRSGAALRLDELLAHPRAGDLVRLLHRRRP